MIASRWKVQEVADVEGLITATGEICAVQGPDRQTKEVNPEIRGWLNVAVLAQQELCSGGFIVKCGEVLENGSFGVVVLESAQQGELVWSFVSQESNPFDKIEVQGNVVLVLSTSGSVFRFTPPAKGVELWIA